MLSVALQAQIDAIRDPRALKNPASEKAAEVSCVLQKYLEGVGHTQSSAPLLRGSFLFSVFLLVSKLFRLSSVCFLYLHRKKTNIFTPFALSTTHPISISSATRDFLNKLSTAELNLTQSGYHQKNLPPPTRKACINRRYISTSCFPCIGLITKNRNSRL